MSGPVGERPNLPPQSTADDGVNLMQSAPTLTPRSGVVYLVPVVTAEQRSAGWLGCVIGLGS